MKKPIQPRGKKVTIGKWKGREYKLTKQDRFKKQCGQTRYKCDNYIPDEYKLCDFCFLAQFGFDTTHDALDHLGLVDLVPQDQVLRVLRIIDCGASVTV